MTNVGIKDLTESQEKAFEGLTEFLARPITEDVNSRVAVLVGKAGTGKTTLIRLILSDLLEADENLGAGFSFLGQGSSVFGVTLAHKAKNVLNKSLPNVNTFASYFGLKEHYEPSGKLTFIRDEFKAARSDSRTSHKVAVHDECSMYDDDMIEMVLKETNPYVKIIFMGDYHQIPPITNDGDSDSSVFTRFENIYYLKERVRQTKGNPIIDLSDIIAEQITRVLGPGEFDDRLAIVLNAIKIDTLEDGKGFQTIKYKEFLEHYKSSSDNYLDSKVVAYRRAKVDAFNSEIRNYIYDHPVEPFIPGEIIYMNDTYYESDSVTNRIKYVCYNSDEYLVDDVVLGEPKFDVDCNLLYVDKGNHTHLIGIDNPFIRVVAPRGNVKFKEISKTRKSAAINEKSSKKKSTRWKYFYDFVNTFGNVSYGYCYTAHKSQGSTFRNVYVDINDILSVGPITTKRKLQAIYTAITRASHNVIFLKSN